MATIAKFCRCDCIKYRAQLRAKREGKVIYSKTQTFNSKKAAQVWAIRHENEISTHGIPTETNFEKFVIGRELIFACMIFGMRA